MAPRPVDVATVDTLAGPDAPDGVRIRADRLPPSTHGSNIRALVTRQAWDQLRIPVAEAANGHCEICGTQPMRDSRPQRPDCHEKWIFEFRDTVPVQRLERLIALCPGCHQVQHSGRALLLGMEDLVVERLQRLNHWSRDQAMADLRRCAVRCRALDSFRWDLDLTALAGQLTIPGHATLYFTTAQRHQLGTSRVPGPRRRRSEIPPRP